MVEYSVLDQVVESSSHKVLSDQNIVEQTIQEILHQINTQISQNENSLKATKKVNKEYETKILDKQIRGDGKDNLSNIESDVSGLVKLYK